MNKYLEIESQSTATEGEYILLNRLLEVAKEAGYTHVKDHWGYQAHDEYTIDEAIEKLKIK